MTRGRVLGVLAGLCWFFTVVLTVFPVAIDVSDTERTRCGRPVAEALSGADTSCVAASRRRVGVISVWLVLSGATSTAFLAHCSRAGLRPE